MTYPQQPQYTPPTAYPQVGQQYAQGQYAPTQTYAPQPQQYVAPVAQATPPTMVEPTGTGSGGTGGSPLKIRELVNRACLVTPVRYVPAVAGKTFNGKPETDSIVFNVIVVDGPVPLQYGESQDRVNGGPPVYAIDTLPAVIEGAMTNNSEVVKSLIEAGWPQGTTDQHGNIRPPANVTIPCRVVIGTQGNHPFLLAALGNPTVDPMHAQADEARRLLGAANVAVHSGMWPDGSPFVAPVPREINGGPRQKSQQNAQAAPAQPTYPPQAAYPPPPPAGQVVYPQTTTQAPVGTHDYYTGPAAGAGIGAPAAQQFAPGSREALLSGQEAPDSWNAQTWATMQPADRARFLPAQ